MNIIMYTKKDCPWCNGVRDLLNEKGVKFEEVEAYLKKKHNGVYPERVKRVEGFGMTSSLGRTELIL